MVIVTLLRINTIRHIIGYVTLRIIGRHWSSLVTYAITHILPLSLSLILLIHIIIGHRIITSIGHCSLLAVGLAIIGVTVIGHIAIVTHWHYCYINIVITITVSQFIAIIITLVLRQAAIRLSLVAPLRLIYLSSLLALRHNCAIVHWSWVIVVIAGYIVTPLIRRRHYCHAAMVVTPVIIRHYGWWLLYIVWLVGTIINTSLVILALRTTPLLLNIATVINTSLSLIYHWLLSITGYNTSILVIITEYSIVYINVIGHWLVYSHWPLFS